MPEYLNFEAFNALKTHKILVEFLRVNSWIQKWFNVDCSGYTISHGGYKHLPLEKKIQILNRLEGYEEISVCEDESEAYEYWKNNVNHNSDDCCNLRRAYAEN